MFALSLYIYLIVNVFFPKVSSPYCHKKYHFHKLLFPSLHYLVKFILIIIPVIYYLFINKIIKLNNDYSNE